LVTQTAFRLLRRPDRAAVYVGSTQAVEGQENKSNFVEAHISTKRMGTPEEIANAIVFIGSDKASYIIGAFLAQVNVFCIRHEFFGFTQQTGTFQASPGPLPENCRTNVA